MGQGRLILQVTAQPYYRLSCYRYSQPSNKWVIGRGWVGSGQTPPGTEAVRTEP